jgi:hypothetical protein
VPKRLTKMSRCLEVPGLRGAEKADKDVEVPGSSRALGVPYRSYRVAWKF